MIILLLTIANGLFSAAEIAIVSLRRSRLRQLVEEGRRSAKLVEFLRAHPERFLATVQVGITVVGATAAAFGGTTLADRLAPVIAEVPFLGRWSEGLALALVIALVSYLSVVLGELVPKSLALRGAERYALLVARPLMAVSTMARPLIWLLVKSSNLLLKPFGDRTTFTESRVSPEEIQISIQEAAKAGMLDPHAGDIAARALEFAELTVADVMVPRHLIDGIPRSASPEEVKRILLEAGHSRMPVYDGSLDNIVGYIVAKDVLAMVWSQQLVVLDDLIRPVHFVPESGRAAAALRELQRRRTRMAIAVDEHGAASGLVTDEDLLEELVGELFSEEDTPEEMIRKEANGTALVRGHTPIRDVNRALEIELPESDAWTTVAGLVIALANRIPPEGTRVDVPDGTRLEIVEASPHVVRLVRVLRAAPA